ncbi:MAG: hypothetical protein ACJ8D0_08190, partial [Xanthobacteraceae bacterium]
ALCAHGAITCAAALAPVRPMANGIMKERYESASTWGRVQMHPWRTCMMSTGSRNNGVIGAAARLAEQLGSVRLLQHWK